MTTALVTGVAGQDGIYLARRLLADGTRVVGTVLPGHRTAMSAYLAGVEVVEHDVRDAVGFRALMDEHAPDEVYNLAAVSSVGASWKEPALAVETNGAAVVRMLETLLARGGSTRFFQAASGEELGGARDSPYARGKTEAHALTTEARERHGLFACAAILYNHESPLRGHQFVTRKITRAAAEISLGKRDRVSLGNLEVSRDWGHARDYVDAMVRIVRHDSADDFVVATGVAHTLEQLLVTAFAAAGIADPWPYVEQDPGLVRPTDTAVMVGDYSRTGAELGWAPETTFEQTIAEMVAVDLRRVRSGVEEDGSYLT
ncbi:MAG TPA: GDP-mannose 4,6-dehydratase [Nocardioidaceae bacterium]|nr:GDP-mannose 4,6-dehydratase [Nocardioidaceae bacterium]